ncbi:MAG: hypothetical protein JO125_09610 [Chloroflexi bacterium]|nr:hypothetical protein [Ktedonobacteraceae bacterium]MBV8821536.1 hypothetical protein [Ktedonobacteraceae bacterium]MBV9020453.1 hypothetical protein [Ktedonobacteraceae bacterium]MBV9707649.1 hypothetical protein [Chloroflexota bacterium]
MLGTLVGIHITNFLGLTMLLVLWIILFKFTHLLIMLLRHEPLIGWAIGPLGITIMSLHEPTAFYIWLDVLCPALVSAALLHLGLFTSLSPITLPHRPLIEIITIAIAVLLTSTGDVLNALRDLRYPLWGEARILRSIQTVRATWAKIHFTPFGYSYLNDHFGANPTDLLQAL